eukprot:IDg16003t1
MAGTAEDPRREDRVVDFKMLPEEELPVDYYALCSLLTALLAVMFKVHSYCWLTLLFVLASFANTMHSSMDVKAMTANAALVVLVFLTTNMTKGSESLLFPAVFANWSKSVARRENAALNTVPAPSTAAAAADAALVRKSMAALAAPAAVAATPRAEQGGPAGERATQRHSDTATQRQSDRATERGAKERFRSRLREARPKWVTS